MVIHLLDYHAARDEYSVLKTMAGNPHYRPWPATLM
jgi:hypothetical protein